MTKRNLVYFLLVMAVILIATGIPIKPYAGFGYSISGTVNYKGSPLQGVVLSGLPGNPTTDQQGEYFSTVPLYWSGVVTPRLQGYTFDPYSRNYTNVNSDFVNQDYTAYPVPNINVGRNVNMVSGTELPGGDPYLQRQNEPSIAVSTRNPMHLLAAANDYRPVYMAESEGPLPGITLKASTGPDAWLGIFKSYNGGQSWTSTLLSKDPPLHEYSTACDPTVRAGSSGLLFTSGIAFNRIEHGASAIFIARFMDNNTQANGDMDSIKYLDVNIIDEGTSGQFADKPWIAVSAPNYGSDTVPIHSPGAPVQYVPRFNVYLVYSIFLGSSDAEAHSKIMFARSTDCGNTWEKPIKLSESVHICQGTNIAVSPKDGTIYIVWRQYAREENGIPHAIVICKSDDSGQTFTKATEVAQIDPFDQFLYYDRFRTSAFPALAVDHNGGVYVAWSQRGVGPYGEARIVIKTSDDGIDWDGPVTAVDNHDGGGHQIMPSLTYAGGKLMVTWYDTRKSLGNIFIDENGEEVYLFHEDIADPGPTGKLHTIDTWVAQADPSDPPANPVFTDSTQVSRYIYEAETIYPGGPLKYDENGIPIIKQVQFNHPNFPLFEGGMAPFIGDYLDITPAPMFLYDYEYGKWRFNTGVGDFDPTLCHITFSCNRDVIPPKPPLDWMNYWPPGDGCLGEITAGMRNQNIYTAPVTNGIMVGSPVNTKPLYPYKSSFLIFVKNLIDGEKIIRLTINAPGIPASFWEVETPQDEECPFLYCGDTVVDVLVLPHSSITLTVFVEPYYDDPFATFRVDVEEIDGDGYPTGLKSSVVLNPDPLNTQFINPVEESHTPTIISEVPDQPLNLSDPTMLSAPIVYSPYLEELLNFSNPDIVAPTLRYPTLRYDSLINPTLRYSTLGNIPNGQVTDLQWIAKNVGNTTSAYSFEAIGETPSVPYQLLIHKISTTPITTEVCLLSEEEHHELLLSIESPTLRYPTLRYPTLRYPTLRYNTFFLAPGEEAVITLRLIDPKNPHPFDPQFYAKTVAGAVIPQATNPEGEIEVANFMWICTAALPDGSVNDLYPNNQLEAQGGAAPYTWSLVDGYGDLPPGLELTLDGIIQVKDTNGAIYYDPNVTYPKNYNFVVQAIDSNGQIAYRSLSIKVILLTHLIKASAGEGGEIDPVGSVEVFHGFDKMFYITADSCFYIKSIETDDEFKDLSSQELSSCTYTFSDVRADNKIHATFMRKTFTITPKVEESGGGTIEPSSPTTVDCDSTPTFTITPDLCYHLVSVKVDEEPVDVVSQDGFYTYTFPPVQQDHTIEAAFDINTYTITASAGEFDQAGNFIEYPNGSGPGGNISPAPEATVVCGQSVTFTISANEGYQLADVLVNGNPASGIIKEAVTIYPFNSVMSNHTIRAIFKKLEAWVKTYNNDSVSGDDEANDIAVDLSGNSYVTGFSLGSPTGPDFYTISYDGDGNVGLSARYDGPAHDGDFANAIAVDNDGNVYVTGYSFRGMAGTKHKDYCTLRYNSSRELVWDARYDARRNGNDEATAIAVDNSGYVYVTGRSEESLSNKSKVLHYDFFTIKYDAENRGREIWGARYNNESVNGADEATAIAVDSTGTVYVTGRSQGDETGFDYVTLKYNSDGDRDWIARYNNDSFNGADEPTAIAVDAAGNVYVTGRSQGSNTGFDYATIKYNSDGSIAWVERYDGGNSADEAVGIAIDSVGDVYITGKSQGDDTGFDYLNIKYNSSGHLIWRARYNNALLNGDDEATAIAVDSTGNVYVTGRSKGLGFDFATVKYKQHIE